MSGPWAIVPVKRFDRAKTRLSVLLDTEQRAALARAMLADVLDVLVRMERLGGIAVVTNDPDGGELARKMDATVVPDTVNAGTNAAVRQGLDWLAQRAPAGVVVVPGDVPFVGERELRAVLDAADERGAALVPALRDAGTNLMALNNATAIQPAFGPNSYSRHLAAAREAGIEPAILDLEGAGHDIDVPSDLVCSASGRATRTRAFVAGLAGHNPTPTWVGWKEELQS